MIQTKLNGIVEIDEAVITSTRKGRIGRYPTD